MDPILRRRLERNGTMQTPLETMIRRGLSCFERMRPSPTITSHCPDWTARKCPRRSSSDHRTHPTPHANKAYPLDPEAAQRATLVELNIVQAGLPLAGQVVG